MSPKEKEKKVRKIVVGKSSALVIQNLEAKISKFETVMKTLEQKVTKLENENRRLKENKEIVVESGVDGFWKLISRVFSTLVAQSVNNVLI